MTEPYYSDDQLVWGHEDLRMWMWSRGQWEGQGGATPTLCLRAQPAAPSAHRGASTEDRGGSTTRLEDEAHPQAHRRQEHRPARLRAGEGRRGVRILAQGTSPSDGGSARSTAGEGRGRPPRERRALRQRPIEPLPLREPRRAHARRGVAVSVLSGTASGRIGSVQPGDRSL